MPKVTLNNPVAWPYPYGIMRHSGTVLDVTESELDQLVELGVVVPAEPAGEVADAPVEDTAKESEVPAEPTGTPQRPKNTAKIDVWRKYAESLGVDHKGLDKAEIIAATR